jgi:hypothetical protein
MIFLQKDYRTESHDASTMPAISSLEIRPLFQGFASETPTCAGAVQLFLQNGEVQMTCTGEPQRWKKSLQISHLQSKLQNKFLIHICFFHPLDARQSLVKRLLTN